MDTRISIVAAVAENWIIGKDGDLPWKLRDDLVHFHGLTNRKTIIVGRKTHESIVRRTGSPLSNRRTIVVTRQPNYQAPGCTVVHSFVDAIVEVRGEDEVFVIGGAEIYEIALPYATEIHLTRVQAHPEGDTFFPVFNQSEWKIVSIEHHQKDARNEYDFAFEVWERRGQ